MDTIKNISPEAQWVPEAQTTVEPGETVEVVDGDSYSPASWEHADGSTIRPPAPDETEEAPAPEPAELAEPSPPVAPAPSEAPVAETTTTTLASAEQPPAS